MQRSKHLAINTDKQWEVERRSAKRAEARLTNGIHEIEEAQLYHVNNMIKEQKRIQKDLMRIKEASRKTSGNPRDKHPNYSAGRVLQHPTNNDGRSQHSVPGIVGGRTVKKTEPMTAGPVMASGSSMTLQMRLNDFMDGFNSRGAKMGPPTVPKPESESSSTENNMSAVNKIAAKRLSISENPTATEESVSNSEEQGPSSDIHTETNENVVETVQKSSTDVVPQSLGHTNTQSVRQRSGSLFKENLVFDKEVYAPDGSLRTMHTMPDLMQSLEDARKARYIRHRHRPDFEKELSIQEIFQKDQGGNSHVNSSKGNAGNVRKK
ncbi:coiled-coil domain-containing protein 190 [Xenopus laevis]|uniref:Coiled-coil domain-containing protein 190 n=2 Tax=Xenopus laevis TaxID=8355 RepID=A0A1L8GGW1_XENLA|nr:coiled-coil domain-containing protein 190 [Xenopus laevis]OCT83077.1 hypothetical protein XELAEV_18025616mg [Xenopus laevis]